MTIQLAGQRLDPPVFLAPMAGITDLPFRRLVARFGAGLVVSEMVASGEMITARPGPRARARIGEAFHGRSGAGGPAVSVQLAGRQPGPMAEAARIVAGMGARIIDINMGCPAKKVTGGLSGAALMRDPDHALRIVEAVADAVDVPVTLKLRLGWDEDALNAAPIAARAEAAGVAMIAVHGRTRMQFYTGCADWAGIRAVRAVVSVPLVANGDVVDGGSAGAALAASGADAVMVGRAAQGRPWRLAEIAHALGAGAAPALPRGAALADLVAGHYEDMLSFYGSELGMRTARKHLGWYAEAAGAEGRADMMRAESPGATLALIARVFAEAPGPVPMGAGPAATRTGAETEAQAPLPQSGLSQTCPAHADPAQTDPAHADSAQTDPAHSAPARSGPAQAGAMPGARPGRAAA